MQMEHKKLAIELFNETWDLLDMDNRSDKDEALMIHKAHASLYHWLQAGKPIHFQRGEWMVSHVYSELKMKEPALFHANQCMKYTQENNIDDYDLVFAYEALARAYAIEKDKLANDYLKLGYHYLEQVKEDENRIYAKSQLDQIQTRMDGVHNDSKTYIYLLKLADRLKNDAAWSLLDNDAVEQHFIRLKKDYESGKVIHVGRTTNPYEDGFGVVIYYAKDDEEASKYMMEDPAVAGGTMSARCQEYNLVFHPLRNL